MSKNQWSNRLSFIITTSAFSVGLGNIWRFPYIAGENGGGAFLLIYLILILVIGIPLMIIEIGLGRMSQSSPLTGFSSLSNNSNWNIVGWLGFLSNFLIMSFYVMILAWILIYFKESLNGHISNLSINELPGHFDEISSNISSVIFFILLIMITSVYIVRKGLQNGLEKYAKFMMIGLVAIIMGLCIWAGTLENAAKGYKWFLTPDFSKITMSTILQGIGQLFFSIGVGMAIAFSFGSYTKKNENLITSTSWIVLTDTIFAILAGLLIFPIIFSFNLSPDSGPNLVFITMAAAFGKLTYGPWIGATFFLLLFLAGFTSLISSIQGLKDSVQDRFKISSWRSLIIVSLGLTTGSIPVVLSYTEDPLLIAGMHMFDFLDYVTNSLMLPISGLLIAIFGAYVIGFDKLKKHLELGADGIIINSNWKYIIQWIIPGSILLILLNGLLQN